MDPGVADALREVEFQYQTLYGCTIAFLVLAIVSVMLRMYVRGVMIKKVGWDDWALVLALLMFCVDAGVGFATYANRQSFLDLISGMTASPALAHFVTLERWANGFYALSIVASKVSLSVFFLNLFNRSHRWHRMYIYFALGVCTVINVTFFIIDVATCGIIGEQNSLTACPLAQTGHDISIAMSAINASVDFSYGVLGVMLMSTTAVKGSSKIIASLLLIFGTLGGVASVMRIVVQVTYVVPGAYGIQLGRWGTIEAGVCISTAGLATCRPLFRLLKNKLFTGTGSSNSRSGGNTSNRYPTATAKSGFFQSKVTRTDIPLTERGNELAELGKEDKNIVVCKEIHVATSRAQGNMVPYSSTAGGAATPPSEDEMPILETHNIDMIKT